MRGGKIDERVRARIAALPGFGDPKFAGWTVEPLGGLTNRSLKLSRDGDSYVLRLPGPGTAGYLDRAREAHNAALAAAAGLSPELLHADPADGTMVTRFIADGVTLDSDRLRDPEMLRAAVGTLKRLHQGVGPFRGEMRLFPQLDAYLAMVRGTPPALLANLEAARADAEILRAALERRREALAPCHIDPAPNNFIAASGADGATRIYLIDWEYSAMSEPTWDLGTLSVEASFDREQDAAMLEAYYGAASPARLGRLAVYKAALDLLGAAWGAVQLAAGNDNADFATFAAARLERFRSALADPAMGRRLATDGG